MRKSSRSPLSSDRMLAYILIGVFTLMIVILIWYGGWYWLGMSELTAVLLTILGMLLPYLGFEAFIRAAAASSQAPPPSATTFNTIPGGTPGPTPGQAVPPAAGQASGVVTPPPPASGTRFGLTNYSDDWLHWLGSGDSRRGTLVLLVIIFWSMLYWSWPTIEFSAFTFSTWGLITTFGLVAIRSLFFRQTAIPGKEVPAASADPKSQPK